MQTRTLLAASFLAVLSACSGECSCGTTGSDDDDTSGSGGSTSETTSPATGTGSGGDTGTGSGGDTGTGSGGDTGSGGSGTGTGTGGGGGSDGVCVVENVEAGGACDVDCDAILAGSSGEYEMCTISCDPLDGSECGADLVCTELEDGTGICVYSCDGTECPGSSEYICDQDLLICDPDGVAG
jgi:hypothetical protein